MTSKRPGGNSSTCYTYQSGQEEIDIYLNIVYVVAGNVEYEGSGDGVFQVQLKYN